MNESEFEWDEGNINHVIKQYPERRNTIEDIESLFRDPNLVIGFDREDVEANESRYWGLGIGTQGILKRVVYVERNDKIRIITCHKAKRNQRHLYHERVNTKPAEGAEGDGSGAQELDVSSGS